MIIVEKKEYQIGVEKKQIIIEMSQRGPSGPRGLKGDTGAQGPQGEKGDQGDPGPTTWDGITDKPNFGELAFKNTIDYDTDITNKPELGSLADHDIVDYEIEVTNKPVFGTMASKDDAPFDSEEYIRKNGGWERNTKNTIQWGAITGFLQNQIDLNLAFMGKADVNHSHGYVGNNGKIGGGSYAITNGDRMLISDASNDNMLVMSNVIFDGASTDKALTKKGSFESFAVPSMLCSFEESMVATQNYTSGDLIIVGKNLYSASMNIASGSTLTTGYNVVLTTFEDVIFEKLSDAPSNNKTYGRKNGNWVEVTGGGGGGGSSIWGEITGTISDQTDLKSALDGKAAASHTHDDRYYTESEVDTLLSAKADSTNLGDLAAKDMVDWDTDIDDIPSTFPPSSHSHTTSDISDFPTLGALASKDKVDWDTDIDDIPSTFTPSSHNHTTSDISDFPTLGALASKDKVDWDTDIDDIPSTFPPSSHTHTTSDISNFPTLGSLAAMSSIDYTSNYITNKPTLGTMASVNDASSDNTMYVRKNGAWVALPVYSGSVS